MPSTTYLIELKVNTNTVSSTRVIQSKDDNPTLPVDARSTFVSVDKAKYSEIEDAVRGRGAIQAVEYNDSTGVVSTKGGDQFVTLDADSTNIAVGEDGNLILYGAKGLTGTTRITILGNNYDVIAGQKIVIPITTADLR